MRTNRRKEASLWDLIRSFFLFLLLFLLLWSREGYCLGRRREKKEKTIFL